MFLVHTCLFFKSWYVSKLAWKTRDDNNVPLFLIAKAFMSRPFFPGREVCQSINHVTLPQRVLALQALCLCVKLPYRLCAYVFS